MIKWLLVVVLLLLAGVGGYLYIGLDESTVPQSYETPLEMGLITTSSNLAGYQLAVQNKAAVVEWMTAPTSFNYHLVLTDDLSLDSQLTFRNGDTVLGSSASKLADTSMVLSLYLSPETRQDKQQSGYVLSYLVLKSVSSMVGSTGGGVDRDEEIIARLESIRDSGGTYPVELVYE